MRYQIEREYLASPESLIANPIDELLQVIKSRKAKGQAEIGDSIKRLVKLVRPDLECHLSESARDWFLEPLAFAYFSAGERGVGLEQVFAGYLRTTPWSPKRFPVHSGPNGYVYIPRFGYFKTKAPSTWLTLEMGSDPNNRALFTPSTFIPSTTIELLEHCPPWIDVCFKDQLISPCLRISPSANTLVHLTRAFTLLRQYCPALSAALQDVLRLIIVFENSDCNSFASTCAQGAVFLNALLGEDEVFYLEDLAHQGGHVLLATAAHNPAEFFTVSPDSSIENLNGDHTDTRSLYVAFHGIFTEALIIHCLTTIDEAGVLHGRQQHELAGRLAFMLNKLAADRRVFIDHDVLSPVGANVLASICKIWQGAASTRVCSLRTTNLSNQNYNFDYQRYANLNPISNRPSKTSVTSRREPLPLDVVSSLGFGCYRTSSMVPEHKRALLRALSLGCSLVDTASNYMDGRSEEFVGHVLDEHSSSPVFVVTKLGYLSPTAERFVLKAGVSPTELRQLSAESKYSLTVDSLRAQLALSLHRLHARSVDAVLIHNPEHELDSHRCDHIVRRTILKRAFEFLETCVAEGVLRYYGVSSNTLVNDWTEMLYEYVDTACEVSDSHHFRIAQFPLNLFEQDAAKPDTAHRTLLGELKRLGIVSIANRPLNAQQSGEFLRLATYESETDELINDGGSSVYDTLISIVGQRLLILGVEHDVMEFSVMKFIRDNWRGIGHPDVVDTIFTRRFYPFVETLWNNDIPPDVRQVFCEFYRLSRLYAKHHLSLKARKLQEELPLLSQLTQESAQTLAAAACAFVLDSGVDHVLVGMRSQRYVDDLRHLISPTIDRRASTSAKIMLSLRSTQPQ